MGDGANSALTAQVEASFDATPDTRLRGILQSLTRHLHAWIEETHPSIEEWEAGIQFLTRTGQTCTDVRQEFILLSDVLGVSMLVETLNGADVPEATDSTVLGPFHMTESPLRSIGADISPQSVGDACVVVGRVVDSGGNPVAHASIDVWQANAEGFYDVQQPDEQPPGNGRGMFTADVDGGFWFRTVVPSAYPIPTDGPVGALLGATRRHPFRPAHIHFIVAAPGYRELVTHIFVAGSDYIDSDAVFAVKSSLIADFVEMDDPALAARYGVDAPFRLARFDVVVTRDDDTEGSELRA
ncbi:dioxygenase family protein [Microbacterium sp. BR1]|uniref:dioxygenase family protein n=1 Tax=Microbacterium sp. BR1 TaxID=1070896 RepID=UPI000C2C7149|nr:dioxygenase [Microbacterium sp. BR1]